MIVQLPDGRPVSIMLPVAVVQFGCVTVPMAGAAGVAGWALITTLDVDDDVQPAALVTVKL